MKSEWDIIKMGGYCCRQEGEYKQCKRLSIVQYEEEEKKEMKKEIKKESEKEESEEVKRIDKKMVEEMIAEVVPVGLGIATQSSIRKRLEPYGQKKGADNYQTMHAIAKGLTGVVVLAKNRQTQQTYAMKAIKKSQLPHSHLLFSDLLLLFSQNDLFVRVFQVFKNQARVYIVMEFLPKRDLFFYIHNKAISFSQQLVSSIASQIIVALQMLHSAGLIYRGLKPQNIFLTDKGHIKLTDFAFSHQMIPQCPLALSFFDIKNYSAPQMIKGPYGQAVDIWALGVLLFEFLFEENPFGSTNEENETKGNSFEERLQIISVIDKMNRHIGKVSRQCRELLCGMLQRDPGKRFTVSQLKTHSFFADVDWEQVSARTNAPPFAFLVDNPNFLIRKNTFNEPPLRTNIANIYHHSPHPLQTPS